MLHEIPLINFLLYNRRHEQNGLDRFRYFFVILIINHILSAVLLPFVENMENESGVDEPTIHLASAISKTSKRTSPYCTIIYLTI